MTLLSVGINHNTAPVSIRERLAFPAESLPHSLQELWKIREISEAAILSTCNRTEFYCDLEKANKQIVIDWIAENRRLNTSEFAPYLYCHTESDLIRHMFRVACGLDSLILGEPQILGQMKAAYQTANDAGTLGKHLGKLFQHTFSAAKKVRTDTEIGSSAVSVAFAAVRLAQQIYDNLGVVDQASYLITTHLPRVDEGLCRASEGVVGGAELGGEISAHDLGQQLPALLLLIFRRVRTHLDLISRMNV